MGFHKPLIRPAISRGGYVARGGLVDWPLTNLRTFTCAKVLTPTGGAAEPMGGREVKNGWSRMVGSFPSTFFPLEKPRKKDVFP